MAKKRYSQFAHLALLDLRAWVAAMFLAFGIMLGGYGLFFVTEEDLAKAAGFNLNLWTGVGMIAFAAVFALWLVVRPPDIATPEDAEASGDDSSGEVPDPGGADAERSDGKAHTGE